MQLTTFGVNAILKLNSLRALKILMIIAENSNDNGECSLTLMNIAKKIDVAHKSNISISVGELENMDFLAIDNKNKRNIYVLNPDYFITQTPYPLVLERYKKIKEGKNKTMDDVFNDFDMDVLLNDLTLINSKAGGN